MDKQLPRILLAAAASGSGKTTVTCALLQALMNRGLRPMAFKCGPDYIDPMFHSRIIGVPSRNLDLFFAGEELTCSLLWENGKSASVAVMEGVMGFYDGVGDSWQASSYHLAAATGTPVVLVADCKGASLTMAASLKGLRDFRPDSGVAAVLLNRCPPARYPAMKELLERELGLPVVGYLPVRKDCALESRHLGLVTAAEVGDLREKMNRLAAQAEETVDLEGLLAIARSAPPLRAAPLPAVEGVAGSPVIGVARDNAFCFYYQDNLDLLERCGARLVPFSPLEDRSLPEGCSGLLLGGGYPELYAGPLAANRPMLAAIGEAIGQGMPVVAECGGFMYLHRELVDGEGRAHRMVGALDGNSFPTSRLVRFGYGEFSAQEDTLLAPKGERIRGHEFHYWDSSSPGESFQGRKPGRETVWPCIVGRGNLVAGYPHFYYYSNPAFARRFVAACARYQRENKSGR